MRMSKLNVLLRICVSVHCGQAGFEPQANVTLSSGAQTWSDGGFCKSWVRQCAKLSREGRKRRGKASLQHACAMHTPPLLQSRALERIKDTHLFH